MARINSVIDDDLLRRLRHVLVDQGMSLSEWIRRQALATVEDHGGKGRKKVKSPIVMPPVPRPDLLPMIERRRKKREG
jgi:hypothetical protein